MSWNKYISRDSIGVGNTYSPNWNKYSYKDSLPTGGPVSNQMMQRARDVEKVTERYLLNERIKIRMGGEYRPCFKCSSVKAGETCKSCLGTSWRWVPIKE